MSDRIHILGVPIDAVTEEEAADRIAGFLDSRTQHHVMTPNPEMLVKAHGDPYFHALLGRTALNVPDGVGLLFAARLQGKRFPARVTGVDLVVRICANPAASPVFFLGAAPGVAESAANALQSRVPSLQIAGTYAGSPALAEEEEIIGLINASGAKTLFVAFGAPVQDLWIDWVLSRLQTVRVAMGVGGAFDFLAGKQQRAPKSMQRIGLEWMWRLMKEPRRLKRIWRAVIVFPVFVLTEWLAWRSPGGASRT
ncbi:MAG: WecB/TagA/CpsF family glycosyltransferase [Candidatus Peribacteraceae bacterium]|nr:WecB/TagA/CpsF family glycosyltransferase [Candidatus Peribacteraceae bacterium]